MAKQFPLSETRKAAFEALNIPLTNRVILSVDGGGMKGIMTIQLLKQLETIAGIPCYELFDMVSGTSTGGIIAGLVASGYNATEIESLYDNLVADVFKKRSLLSDRLVDPPKFTKKKYRDLLKEKIGNISLQDACKKTGIDIMITAKDMSAAEETFFTCFNTIESDFYGTYKDVLLRAVMEATMSAPTYFYPLERFVDGGTTTYNNPSMAAIIEAISYSRSDDDNNKYNYKIKELTVFSFGTGISREFIKPNEPVNPKGIDVKFWLDWLMSEMGQDASAMLVHILRTPIMKRTLDYRRFQISLDPETIKQLPNTDALDATKYGSKWLHDITETHLKEIDMSDLSKYDLMKIIGTQLVEYIMLDNKFKSDLIDKSGKRDELVAAFGDIVRIKKQMSDPEWLDNFIA